MRVSPWFAAALLLAACAPKPETPEQMAARLKAESDSARVAIEANNARFAQFVVAGKVDSAAMGYAEDAVFYPDRGPAARGRAAIAKAMAAMLQEGTITSMVVKTISVEASGPLAVETGTNAWTMVPKTPAGAKPVVDTLKYVTTWRKVGGQWLITNDIANSAIAPAPATKR